MHHLLSPSSAASMPSSAMRDRLPPTRLSWGRQVHHGGRHANFLSYDVYDLDLSAVSDNKQLRNLLSSVGGKSVLVVEDINRSL